MTPRPQEQLFEKKYAHELLRIAAGDLESAQALSKQSKGRAENTCFLAQQSIEKALKAVLVWNQIPFPLVHDAGILVAKMPAGVTPPLGYDLSVLTSYATVRRYEESRSILTRQAIDDVLTAATAVLQWSKNQCQ